MSQPVVLGREARSKQRSARHPGRRNRQKAYERPGQAFFNSRGEGRQGVVNTTWGLRLRHKSLLERGQARSFTSPRPPRRVLRPHHLGTGGKPGTASRCACASRFSGPRTAASSAPASAGAATSGAAGCSRLHHAQPWGRGGLWRRTARLPRPAHASPGQGAAPRRHEEGEVRAERPGPRGPSFGLLKIYGALGRGEQEGKLRERLRGDRNPGRDLIGLPGPEFLPHPPGQGPRGPQARARRSGRGFCSLGGR